LLGFIFVIVFVSFKGITLCKLPTISSLVFMHLDDLVYCHAGIVCAFYLLSIF
jgi:hypothetical protein